MPTAVCVPERSSSPDFPGFLTTKLEQHSTPVACSVFALKHVPTVLFPFSHRLSVGTSCSPTHCTPIVPPHRPSLCVSLLPAQVSHTEPDHSFLVPAVLDLYPEATVVASKVALNFLSGLTNR